MEPIVRNWEIAGRDPKTGKFILKQVEENLLHTQPIFATPPPNPAPQRQPKKKLSETGYRSEITFGNDMATCKKPQTPKKSETNKTYKRVLVDYVEENENGSQTISLKKPPLLLKYNGKHNFVGAKTIAIEFSFFINANPDKENEITDNSILF